MSILGKVQEKVNFLADIGIQQSYILLFAK